uniref:Exocyst complex component 7 n=1 Tax=Parastrongyloides trichosuri TaxID=131310 RepID=A0A0N4Z6G2_PARTI
MNFTPTNDGVTAIELTKRLEKDQEWIESVKSSLKKSKDINNSICQMIDNFSGRLGYLEKTVMPLCLKTDKVQKRQQNVNKLLNLIDTTMQFYEKTSDLEEVMRAGNAVNNLDEFLKKMDNINGAIHFFSSQKTYEDELEKLKVYHDAGLVTLEGDFRNIVLAETINLDSEKILENLDEENEPITTSHSSLRSLRDIQKVGKCCKWLLKNSKDTMCINTYTLLRSQTLFRTINNLMSYITSNLNSKQNTLSNINLSQSKVLKVGGIRNALRKIAKGNENEKGDMIEDHKDSSLDYIVELFSSLLMLLEIEADIASQVIGNVKLEALVQRVIVTKPMIFLLDHLTSILDLYDTSFLSLIPVCKFFQRHHNQLAALSENAEGEHIPYNQVYNTLNRTCSSLIREYVDKLQNDTTKSVPMDGNVHQITANTISILKSLLQQKQIISNILAISSHYEKNHVPRLFAEVLSALGKNLKNKCQTFQDDSLAAIFMLNNYNYISKRLQDPAMQTVMKDDINLTSFYQMEISNCVEKYLVSWQKISSIVSQPLIDIDKRQLKVIYSIFEKELEQILETQKNYTVVDGLHSKFIKSRIKEMILKNHERFYVTMSETIGGDKNFKYDAGSLEVVIDELFDNSN